MRIAPKPIDVTKLPLRLRRHIQSLERELAVARQQIADLTAPPSHAPGAVTYGFRYDVSQHVSGQPLPPGGHALPEREEIYFWFDKGRAIEVRHDPDEPEALRIRGDDQFVVSPQGSNSILIRLGEIGDIEPGRRLRLRFERQQAKK